MITFFTSLVHKNFSLHNQVDELQVKFSFFFLNDFVTVNLIFNILTFCLKFCLVETLNLLFAFCYLKG